MKNFCVIGLGKFGRNLALNLYEGGAEVMVIDKNADIINSLADKVTSAVIGDPTSEEVLAQVGISEFDCVIVSMVSNVNDSIMITLLCKEMGVGHIIARAADEMHKKVLERIGADQIILPEQDMAEKLARTLTLNNVLDYIEYSEDYSIIEIAVPERWIGKSIIDIDIRRNYDVTVISRRGKNGLEISPDPHADFEPGDTISLLGKNENIEHIADRAK